MFQKGASYTRGNSKLTFNSAPNKIRNFTLVKKLGKGSYGHVGIYRYKKNKKRYIIKRTDGKRSDFNEVMVLKKIQKVCKGYFPCYRTSFTQEGHFYIVMEIDVGYVAMDKFADMDHSDEVKAKAVANAFTSLYMLHRSGFAHLDFKPANVIIHPKKLHAKVIDFGMSCNSRTCKSGKIRGTRKYMSPEMLKGKVTTVTSAKKSDIWSAGVFLYNIVHGSYPWKSTNKEKMSSEISKTKCVMSRNKVFGRLISSILKANPNHRPKLPVIIKWLDSIAKQMAKNQHKHKHNHTSITNFTTTVKQKSK